MFTGIIEELGSVRSRSGDRFSIDATSVLEGTSLGDSIAVSGCCLTVVELASNYWSADISTETRQRTNLDELKPGSAVNLERAVRSLDRLGGHLVQGHIDVVGVVEEPGESMVIRIPADLLRYVVEKGSIAVNGVSLTVADVSYDHFSVALIPHTLTVTNLGRLSSGDTVNIEVDVMAKYAEKLLLHIQGDGSET